MNRVASHWLGKAVLASVAAMSASAADSSLQGTFARMDRAAAGFTGISANFRKVAHTAVLNEDSTDTGIFLLKRPKAHEVLVLWDIKEPDAEKVAIDTRKVEIYHPVANVVQEYRLGEYKSMVDQFLLLGFGSTSEDLQSGYAISAGGAETVGTDKTMRLELIPKSPEILKYFKKIELWISDATGVPVQQKLTEPSGDTHVATYSNIMINPNLPDSAVKLNLPKGVKREYPQK
ncbi:MAG: outer membrane lipoprotein carrier protein LolA [Acidobacteriia bacterium]|nr:outer membrane lipoprotein carrier protein LolA [Terriglobia bacterium]